MIDDRDLIAWSDAPRAAMSPPVWIKDHDLIRRFRFWHITCSIFKIDFKFTKIQKKIY